MAQEQQLNPQLIQQAGPAAQAVSVDFMTPSQKVAALLISLGPSAASEIMKNISDQDLLEQITFDIANMRKIDPEMINEILKEFHSLFIASDYVNSGGMNYAQTLLEKAYGSEKADKILGRLVTLLNSNPFQFFADADPSQLATSFQNENPQLIALILAYLKPELSAKVMNFLSPAVQASVALKIAEMNTTNPEILSEVEKIVESKFSSIMVQDFYKTGGVEMLSEILNCSDRATEKNVMELLENENAELAEQVRELMFVFEDIVKLDDKTIQRILREIDSKDLAKSLKGTKEDVKDKIFKNMSERAQGILQNDMEYMGPIRAKEVQETQIKIVGIIRTLESNGEIVILRESQEDELIE